MVWARDLSSHRYWTHDRTGAGDTGGRWRRGLHQEPGKVTKTILLASIYTMLVLHLSPISLSVHYHYLLVYNLCRSA